MPLSDAASDAPDQIEALGALVLDHRFLRLTHRLLGETREIFERLGIDFGPKWVSTYELLAEESPMAVSEIAQRLRMSHPAVIKITGAMARRGLVRARQDRTDGRRRLLSLTPKARAMRRELARVWEALSEAQLELFRELDCDILDLLARLDAALRERSLADRVMERLGGADAKPRRHK